MWVARLSAMIWSEKVRCSSKIKPRLRAEWVLVREQSCILESCCLRSISRNSVLEELRVRRLAVIQKEICCRSFCKWPMLEWKSDGWKERKSCVSSAYRWWFKERDETILSGVVYSIQPHQYLVSSLSLNHHLYADDTQLYTWQRAEGRELSLGDTTEASMRGGKIVIAFDTKTARGKIGSEPV